MTRILSVYNKNDSRIFERPVSDELFGQYGVLGYAKTDFRAAVHMVDSDVTTIDPEELVKNLLPSGPNFEGKLKSAQPEPTPAEDFGPVVFDDIGRQDDLTDEELLANEGLVVIEPIEVESLNLGPIPPSVPAHQHTSESNVEQSTRKSGWINSLQGWAKVTMVLYVLSIIGIIFISCGCVFFTIIVPILFGN